MKIILLAFTASILSVSALAGLAYAVDTERKERFTNKPVSRWVCSK